MFSLLTSSFKFSQTDPFLARRVIVPPATTAVRCVRRHFARARSLTDPPQLEERRQTGGRNNARNVLLGGRGGEGWEAFHQPPSPPTLLRSLSARTQLDSRPQTGEEEEASRQPRNRKRERERERKREAPARHEAGEWSTLALSGENGSENDEAARLSHFVRHTDSVPGFTVTGCNRTVRTHIIALSLSFSVSLSLLSPLSVSVCLSVPLSKLAHSQLEWSECWARSMIPSWLSLCPATRMMPSWPDVSL